MTVDRPAEGAAAAAPLTEGVARAGSAIAGLIAADGVGPHTGMRIEQIGEHCAVVSLLPAPWMFNGAGMVHGGLLFTLADHAFGCACNTEEQLEIAEAGAIEFLRPAWPGKRLVATASEVSRQAGGATYEVSVVDEDGREVARMTGTSRLFTPR